MNWKQQAAAWIFAFLTVSGGIATGYAAATFLVVGLAVIFLLRDRRKKADVVALQDAEEAAKAAREAAPEYKRSA